MLRDKTRFARRLHGVKKVKNPESQQAILQEMAQEISQAAGKVLLREAARPAITYPETCRLARKTRDSRGGARSPGGDRRRREPVRAKPPSCQKSAWSWAAG
ncbi:hypothetical protein LNP25_22215 [Klebsiella variicola subsp. variicola]|nr:hypothetical protein [Klebsiella variicola subsp. variicola]